MEGGKKIVAIVVLLVVIVAVVSYTIRKRVAPPAMPDHATSREVERIDSKTNTGVVKTHGEWLKLGHKDGKYRNPETGEYTMVAPMTCNSCGKKIPRPETPADIEELGAEGQDDINANYMCPLCGEHAFEPRE